MDDATGGRMFVGIIAGLSSLGFYIFLAVWVASVIWSRTKEKLAVQETLRKLIDSGTPLTPDVIDALRRPKPRRSPEEIRSSAKKYLYWGTFLVVLGLVITVWGSTFRDSPVR